MYFAARTIFGNKYGGLKQGPQKKLFCVSQEYNNSYSSHQGY